MPKVFFLIVSFHLPVFSLSLDSAASFSFPSFHLCLCLFLGLLIFQSFVCRNIRLISQNDFTMVFLLNNNSHFLLIGKSSLILSACPWKYCLMSPIPAPLPASPPALLTCPAFSPWFPGQLLHLNQACYLNVIDAVSTPMFRFRFSSWGLPST